MYSFGKDGTDGIGRCKDGKDNGIFENPFEMVLKMVEMEEDIIIQW
jgi:hypothetical protein